MTTSNQQKEIIRFVTYVYASVEVYCFRDVITCICKYVMCLHSLDQSCWCMHVVVCATAGLDNALRVFAIHKDVQMNMELSQGEVTS